MLPSRILVSQDYRQLLARSGMRLIGLFMWILEGRIVLQYRQHLLREEPEAAFELGIWQSTERECPDNVFECDCLMDVAQLFKHLFRCPGRMQAAEKLNRLNFGLGVSLQLAVGLFQLGVELITFDAPQVAVGEVIMFVDRIPHSFQIQAAQFRRLTRIFRYEYVQQSDRRPWRDAVSDRRLAITSVVRRRIFPTPLGDYQHAQAQLRHDLR